MKPDSAVFPGFCRWPFALAVTTATTAAGIVCSFVLDRLDPVSELDYWFYTAIYTLIGTITGLAAWFCARLIANSSVSVLRLTLGLAPPYAFVLLLALDKNPFVAIVATAAFGFILILTWLAHVVHHRSITTLPPTRLPMKPNEPSRGRKYSLTFSSAVCIHMNSTCSLAIQSASRTLRNHAETSATGTRL